MSDAIDSHYFARMRALVTKVSGGWLLPAAASALLHGLAILVLLGDWWPQAPAGAPVLRTQLLTLTQAVAEPDPVPPAPLPPPSTTSPPTQKSASPVEPVVDQAAIARQRAEEEREQQRREQRQEEQRLAEQRAREEERRAEQQRLARQAEQQRLAAEARAMAEAEAEAAAMAQYQPIDKVPPTYPRRALEKRTEGDCTVSYTVAPDGRVREPQVVDGACDDPIFIRPSLEAARAFRYQPRLVNGQAVAVHDVRNTFRYRIQ